VIPPGTGTHATGDSVMVQIIDWNAVAF